MSLTIRCFLETAGKQQSLADAPANWREIVLSGTAVDSIYFGDTLSTDEKIAASKPPPSGEALAPVMRITKTAESSSQTVVIPNYGLSGKSGRYVLAIQFSGTGSLVDRPRLEAWDSSADADAFTAPTHEAMAGTTGNSKRSMVRAYDVTKAIADSSDLTSPPSSWWLTSTFGIGTENNKLLSGEASYLVAQQDLSLGETWYVALACVLPFDAMKGMQGHRFIFQVRAFYADE